MQPIGDSVGTVLKKEVGGDSSDKCRGEDAEGDMEPIELSREYDPDPE